MCLCGASEGQLGSFQDVYVCVCVCDGAVLLRAFQKVLSRQRIAGITSMLQQSLEGLLIEGLQTGNVDMVRHCLRTYATIDKTRDAEALVGQVLVKPYMDQVNVPLSDI